MYLKSPILCYSLIITIFILPLKIKGANGCQSLDQMLSAKNLLTHLLIFTYTKLSILVALEN